MTKREIDDATFARAFGAQPRSGIELAKWEKLRATVTIYLAELPEPEPARDRIAVVVGRNNRSVTRRLWAGTEDEDMDEIWMQMEGQLCLVAKQFGEVIGPFARAIVRCNLPRPAQPIEVDGTVEEIGG